MKSKICTVCLVSFSCNASGGDAACWCSDYPAVLSPEPGQDCLCPDCLKKRINDTIHHLIGTKKITERMMDNYAGKENLIEGIDYYVEKGLWVFTAWYHLKRGHCCNSGCRHCPYKSLD